MANLRKFVGARDDGTDRLVERLRSAHMFNPSSTVTARRGSPLAERVNVVKYNKLVIKNSLETLGLRTTRDALDIYTPEIPRIIEKTTGRLPGTVGFDPQEDIDCANNYFVRFVGHLERNDLSPKEGIEGFVESLELDSPYMP